MHTYIQREKEVIKLRRTLNPVPMEENFEDLEDSSGKGGNKLATKAHFEAFRSA